MLEGHLVIGYITGGRSCDDFFTSVMGARLFDKRITDVIFVKGPYIAHNKNNVVRAFLALPDAPEWLLMIDNDEQFPRWGPGKLLDVTCKVGARVAGCNYTQTNYSDGFYKKNGSGLYNPVLPLEANRVYRRLDAIAGGFNLVNRSVYEQMALKYPAVYPWYWHDAYDNNGNLELPGEDFSFCRRVQECGFEIIGFTGVPIVHIKEQAMLPTYMAPLQPKDSREYLGVQTWR